MCLISTTKKAIILVPILIKIKKSHLITGHVYFITKIRRDYPFGKKEQKMYVDDSIIGRIKDTKRDSFARSTVSILIFQKEYYPTLKPRTRK